MSELLTLLDRAQNGDNDACQQVLTENVGLIWSIVKRYSGCGVDTDDSTSWDVLVLSRL